MWPALAKGAAGIALALFLTSAAGAAVVSGGLTAVLDAAEPRVVAYVEATLDRITGPSPDSARDAPVDITTTSTTSTVPPSTEGGPP